MLFVDSSGWASGVHDHFVAVAEYDFDAQNSDELTFKQGTVLTLAPKGLVLIVDILFVLTHMYEKPHNLYLSTCLLQ